MEYVMCCNHTRVRDQCGESHSVARRATVCNRESDYGRCLQVRGEIETVDYVREWVHNARSKVVCGCETRENVRGSGDE